MNFEEATLLEACSRPNSPRLTIASNNEDALAAIINALDFEAEGTVKANLQVLMEAAADVAKEVSEGDQVRLELQQMLPRRRLKEIR